MSVQQVDKFEVNNLPGTPEHTKNFTFALDSCKAQQFGYV